ncbi:hypothetical protein [Brevibacterium casei]|uniref:Uncharacterized protein n=1 Tax=Brevibacterium casei TaxID=33889 RepID=A0A7T3ZZA7_9MICO|nr:hypothetical protein [Brevibacterium casei]QQB14367.1 hypothetical protein I6H47_16795 [Brevibacterium casei]
MEIVRDLKLNWVFVLMKMVILGLVLILVYQVAAFAEISKNEISRSFSTNAEVDMYGITDTLVDPDAFAAFRESREGLDSVARFYNELNDSAEMTFLSVFDQPISVVDFEGGAEFDASFGGGVDTGGEYIDEETGRRLTDVKAFQMNEHAFDFHSLRLADGPGIDWSSVDYQSRTIPVVLGADYTGIYEVGDVLESNYYFEDFSLVVGGFLSPDASIYYQGDLNTFIDDAIIVPYPPDLEQSAEQSQFFFGILAFAMIAGDLAVDTAVGSDDVLRHLGEIANRVGFDDFTVLNAPTYLVQFQLTRQLIQDNASLLVGVAALLIVCVGLSNGIIGAHVARRRWRVQKIEHLLGISDRVTLIRTIAVTVIEYMCLLVGLAILVIFLPQANLFALTPVAVIVAVFLIADILSQDLMRRHNIRNRLLGKGES